MIGNSVEIIESFDTLKGKGPQDIKDLTYKLGAEMLKLAGKAKTDEEAYAIFDEKIASGAAGEKMKEIMVAHGADPKAYDDYSLIPLSDKIKDVTAEADGYIAAFNTEEVGVAGMLLGAGRQKKEDDVDPTVGIKLLKKLGDSVKKGDVVAQFYYNGDETLAPAIARFNKGVTISDVKPEPFKLILDIVQ